MNWAQFKDPVSICVWLVLCATYQSLTQEVVGSSPFTVMRIQQFSGTFRKNSIVVLRVRRRSC